MILPSENTLIVHHGRIPERVVPLANAEYLLEADSQQK